MADTGAPWNLPYPLPTDLVRDGADAIKDLAEATADSLGLVAVKHVLKTDPFSASVTAGANVAIGGTNALSITHEVADPANRLIITAYFGSAATTAGRGELGIGINEFTAGGTPENVLIGLADEDGARPRLNAGGTIAVNAGTVNDRIVTMPSITFVHTPGAGSKTYTVRAINISGFTQTLYVNRTEEDSAGRPRATSGLVIQEVRV